MDYAQLRCHDGAVTPDEWRAQVGDQIRYQRDDVLGLSVRKVAKRAGVSEGLWRQLESGRRVLAKGIVQTVSPKPATVWAVCAALGWTPNSIGRLLCGEPPEPLATQPGDDPLAELRAELAAHHRLIDEQAVQMGGLTARLEDLCAVVEHMRGRERPAALGSP